MPQPPPITLQPKNFRANRLLWLGIGLVLAADALLVAYWGMAVRIAVAGNILFILAACAAIGIGFRTIKRDDVLCLFGNTIAQMIVMGITFDFLHQLTIHFNLPLMDATLSAADRFLHLNWPGYIGWVNAHPNIAFIFSIAYESYNVQGIVLICLLFLYKNAGHAQRMVMISFLSALLCILLGAFCPAVNMYYYLHMDLANYPNLHPDIALLHGHVLDEMRDMSNRVVSFPTMGVVMLPSFHAAMAVFLVYGSLPFRWLRLIIIPLNIFMLFSLPVDGGHYFVDVPGGLAVAALGVYIARRILPD